MLSCSGQQCWALSSSCSSSRATPTRSCCISCCRCWVLLQTAPTIQEWGVLLPDLVLLVDEALFHLVWVVILHAAAVLLDALVERGCAAVGVWHVIRGDSPREVCRAWDQNTKETKTMCRRARRAVSFCKYLRMPRSAQGGCCGALSLISCY